MIYPQKTYIGVDTVLYEPHSTDATKIVLKAGGQFSLPDGTLIRLRSDKTLDIDTDLTTDDTLTADTWYYLWSNGTTTKFSADASAAPSDVPSGQRLRGAVLTDASKNIIPFDTLLESAVRGVYLAYSGHRRPANALVAEGGTYLRSAFLPLYAITGNVGDLAFTANAGTNFITSPAHGFLNNDTIDFHAVDGALPSGLSEGTTYYVINKTTDTFQVSLSLGGSVNALGSTETGRCTVAPLATFKLMDWRGRTIIGAGQGSGLTLRRMGATVGKETHALTSNENASHTHTGPSHTHTMAHTHQLTLYGAASPYGYLSHSGQGITPAAYNTTGASSAANTGGSGTGATGSSGSGADHNTMQPSGAAMIVIPF